MIINIHLFKTLLFCFLLLIISNTIRAQDTIFMKSGVRIEALIQEIGDVEIKYKKFAQPEPVGIYTVFISDITKIHYYNGNIVDYTLSDKNSNNTNETDLVPAMKINLGLSTTYFKRNKSDNLLLFWRHINRDNSLEIGGSPLYYSINIGYCSALGTIKRTWFGCGLQLMKSESDAIYTSNYFYGLNEIKLRIYYYNIPILFGQSINHKKNIILIFEPSMDLGFMSGHIMAYDKKYKVSGFSMASHFATGLDWIISKRFLASFRVGKKFMKMDEWHESSTSKTGSSRFYVNKDVNNDLLDIKWSGIYTSLGLSYSLYAKMKSFRPE